MNAYQVFKGDQNKHGFQEYDLQATYLSKEKALEHAQKLVDETPLYGDILKEEEWYNNGNYNKSWDAYGWEVICICRVEEIDIID